ncbi:MAG: hypothetical protein ISS28_00960 [Candidatus Cloacimonetes bacterium]|nr:hypothetical protein [Candidatus Cloacimonadota bacterium]MBL7085658.1 hypothetical protein [Candidatus Cloacimonadota bacterium]
MITNKLLEEKIKAQKRLDEKAHHDIKQYIENSHKSISKIESKYGVKVKYVRKDCGYLESLQDND